MSSTGFPSHQGSWHRLTCLAQVNALHPSIAGQWLSGMEAYKSRVTQAKATEPIETQQRGNR